MSINVLSQDDFSITVDVECDTRNCAEGFFSSEFDDWESMIKELKEANWKIRKVDAEFKHFCEGCSKL